MTKELVKQDYRSSSMMIFENGMLEKLNAFANVMSTSTITIPVHLRNKPGDCLAIAIQAMQWGLNPFTVAQKTFLVNGILGYEAQLVNAIVQNSGAVKGAFKYEYEGEGSSLKCRVGSVLSGESEITWGEWLSSSSVIVKNSPLWKTNPKQQLGYLQVKNWARAYAPGALLGVYTHDELVTITDIDQIKEGKTNDVLANLASTVIESTATEQQYESLESVLEAINSIDTKEAQIDVKKRMFNLSPNDLIIANNIYQQWIESKKQSLSTEKQQQD